MTLIRSQNVYDLRFDRGGLAYIDDQQAAELDQVDVRRGDVLLNITGASVARCCVVPEDILPARVNQHVAILRASEKLNADYLAYLLVSPQWKAELLAVARAGATREALTKSFLEKFAIPVPPLDVQRRIASILSAYDDLIENNTRRIAILEEMARRLYEEWFVHFRFPGHERVPMVESPIGLVPSAWNVGRVDEALLLQRGFDLPVSKREEGPYTVLAATGPHGSHSEAKVKGPGVVTGRSGSLGTVTYSHEDFWPLNTVLWVKEFRSVSPIYAYFLLSRLDLAGRNSGAAVPTLNRNFVHQLVITIPPRDLIEHFDRLVQPTFSLVRTLRSTNATLHASRDFLLPKLISGEIDVSAAPTPEEAAQKAEAA